MIFLNRDTHIYLVRPHMADLKVYLETIAVRCICFHLPTALYGGEVGLNGRSVSDRSLHLLLHITRTFVLLCYAFFLLHN